LNALTEKLESLQTGYHKTNVDSEPYSTTDNDFRRVLLQERRRHEWRENGMTQKDCEKKGRAAKIISAPTECVSGDLIMSS
jgi:hypothetical protein